MMSAGVKAYPASSGGGHRPMRHRPKRRYVVANRCRLNRGVHRWRSHTRISVGSAATTIARLTSLCATAISAEPYPQLPGKCRFAAPWSANDVHAVRQPDTCP
jgi:hypothetical protein